MRFEKRCKCSGCNRKRSRTSSLRNNFITITLPSSVCPGTMRRKWTWPAMSPSVVITRWYPPKHMDGSACPIVLLISNPASLSACEKKKVTKKREGQDENQFTKKRASLSDSGIFCFLKSPSLLALLASKALRKNWISEGTRNEKKNYCSRLSSALPFRFESPSRRRCTSASIPYLWAASLSFLTKIFAF